MPRLKDILPNLFGGNKNVSSKAVTPKTVADQGRLETDALPVYDEDEHNGNRPQNQQITNAMQTQSAASTPTVSADLTASVVRELSNPDYNSMEVALLPSVNGNGQNDSMALANLPDRALMASPYGDNSTMNTMNVHNAQQQLVMQFSNVNNLQIGSVFNIGSSVSAKAASYAAEERGASTCGETAEVGAALAGKRHARRVGKTTSIVSMMQSQEEPNHRMLDTIATHLGEGWKDIMRKLGQSEGQIDQAVIDHQMHGGIREVIYQLLLQWVRNAEDGSGTIGYITTLLWENNQRDCVQRMKLMWKAELNRKTST